MCRGSPGVSRGLVVIVDSNNHNSRPLPSSHRVSDPDFRAVRVSAHLMLLVAAWGGADVIPVS